ncbi:MAG: hypothetical protein RI564_10175 [Gracilimonas sp.]|nr:hypothetical protein [Gracilimonas sp.]
MNKLQVLLFFFITLTLFSIKVVAQNSGLFTKKSEITLPDNHLIGNIEGLDVWGDSFLINDTFQQQQVYLYKKGSDALVRLDPAECFPGFKYDPIHAFHLDGESLFLVNAALPGYRFKPNGDCLGNVEKGFTPVHKRHIAVGENEEFFTLRMMPDGEVLLTQYDETGEPEEEVNVGKHPLPHFNYRFEGGGIAFHEGVLFYMLAAGKVIYRYDVERKRLLKEISFEPSYASVITNDIPGDPFSNVMFKAIDNTLSAHFVIHSVFKLSETFLLIQTSFRENESRMHGIHLLNLSTLKIKEMMITEQPFIFARGGKAYQINDQREEDGDMLNPGITVFEFIEN